MQKRINSFIMAFILLLCIVPSGSVSVDAEVVRYWPVPGHRGLSQGYWYKNPKEYHRAIDICDANIEGATVIASVGGTVVATYRCGEQHAGDLKTCSGFGTGLQIRGDDGWYYQYAHMQPGSMPDYVQNGAYISAGQMVGRVGTTGAAYGPHLHFEISTSMWAGDINPETLTFIDTTPGASYLNIGDDFEAYIKFSATGHGVCNVNSDVQLGTYGSVESKWRFIRQSDGTYKIVSAVDGSVMDVKDFSSVDETNLQTFTSNDSAAQRFYIQKAGDKYNIISSFCGKAVDVKDGVNSTAGTNVHIYSQTGTVDQIFEINKISEISAANCINIGDDFEAYIKLPATGHGVCNVNKNVELGTYGSLESKWRFIHQSDGSYKIVSAVDGRVMDVKDFSLENETNLQTFTSNDSAAQRFYILQSGDNYNIISAFCGKAVAARDGIYSTTGTNVVIYSQNGLPGQIFEINKTVSMTGDVNSDNSINNKDLGLLMQYLNDWEVEIVVAAADVNGDGAVNNKDYGILMQYCNGWDVVLQ